MARTYRRDDREGRTIRDGDDNMHYYRKEIKEIRVRHARDTRHHTKQSIREGDFENLPDYPHTGGRESW